MRFVISTACFFPALTEAAAKILADNRVSCAEVFINAVSELTPEFLGQLAGIFRQGGVQVASIHPFTSGFEPMLFFGQYERRFWDGVELYRRFFAAAAFLGAEYLVIHGDKKESQAPEELYFARFGRLDEIAGEYGVKLAQENVSRCKAGSLAFLKRMKAALPKAALVLDVKQARRAGEDLEGMLEALGESVRHIHLSGCGREGDCLPLDRGEFDFSCFFRRLAAIGFDGSVILELYRQNYGGYEELFRSWRLMEECGRLLKNGQAKTAGDF